MEVLIQSPTGAKTADTSPVRAKYIPRPIDRVTMADLDGKLGFEIKTRLINLVPSVFNEGNWRTKLSSMVRSPTAFFAKCESAVCLAMTEHHFLRPMTIARVIFLFQPEGVDEAPMRELLRGIKRWAISNGSELVFSYTEAYDISIKDFRRAIPTEIRTEYVVRAGEVTDD